MIILHIEGPVKIISLRKLEQLELQNKVPHTLEGS